MSKAEEKAHDDAVIAAGNALLAAVGSLVVPPGDAVTINVPYDAVFEEQVVGTDPDTGEDVTDLVEVVPAGTLAVTITPAA